MTEMTEMTLPAAVGFSLTGVVCPLCGKPVSVECGDVTGLGLEGMIAVALAKADRAHVTFGTAVEHGPVSVSCDDAGNAGEYRSQAAAVLRGGLPVRDFP